MFKEVLKDIFPLLEKFAPTIATTIGTPAAGLATTFALSLLANKFGIDPKNIHELPAAMRKDPNCNDKLQQLEELSAEWFKHNSMQIPAPTKAEVNVHVEWDKPQG